MTDKEAVDDRPSLDVELSLIFGLYHVEEWSVSRIGRHVNRAHVTIREILKGDRYPNETAKYRRVYPPYSEAESAFTDRQLVDMFRLYHNEGMSLSEIGRLMNTTYITVRRVLSGDYHADRTEHLRAEYPAYNWFRGITSFSDEQLEDIFRRYHENHESLDDLAAAFGTVRNTISNLLAGRRGGPQTEQLRAKYGTTVRARGYWSHRAAATTG